MRPFLPVIIF